MPLLKKKRFWIGLIVVVFIAALAFVVIKFELPTQLRIGAGYEAKILCSGVFISGRAAESVLSEDIGPVHPLFKLIKSRVDYDKKAVQASFLGLWANRAVYHPQLGTVLLSGVPEEAVKSWPVEIPDALPADPESIPWPTGDLIADATLPPGVDKGLLDRAVDQAFQETDPKNPLRTRAVLVVHDGRLIAERYVPGISPSTPLLGWSMTKSLASTLVGILVGQGKLDVKAPAAVPEWQMPDDPRRDITLEHLLWMSSGLRFHEAYAEEPVSDVNLMLFTEPDMAAFTAGFPLEAAPGTKYNYSTGTTNLICRIIRGIFADPKDYYAFPRTALFNKIGMRSAVLEADASGTFLCGCCLYACARDWARLGLLYLNDGVWEGERILPEGWVAYATTPAPTSEKGEYGAQIQLNQGPQGRPEERPFPRLPQDLYYFWGYQGQNVFVIPSRKLVAVRLGMTTSDRWPRSDFLESILKALPE